MSNIVQLRQDIVFNARLAGLLDALKSIATQQFQALERSFRSHEALFGAIQTIAATLPLERLSHPYTQPDGKAGVIAVTSDTGLLGGLNQQVISVAAQEYRRNPGELMVIGERGLSYVKERKLSCKMFPGILDSGRRALAGQVRDYALSQALAGAFSSLTIVHPRALSFTAQRVEVLRALPCTVWLKTTPGRRPSSPVLLESATGSVLEYLVRLWLGQSLYEVFGMSRLAELAARSMHLEGSAQELTRRGQKLKLKYFRERHEVIDRSMRELFAARSLYGSN